MIRPAFVLLSVLSLLTGVIYPVGMTALAQVLFPWKANGSLLTVHDQIVGSALIGQEFKEPNVFWGRPSASRWNAAASGGSHWGPSNPALAEAVSQRVAQVRENNPVPADWVTMSGSGLDPEISPAAALYQVPRIARARGMTEADLRRLVRAHTLPRTFGVLGEPRVNVLQLNLALEQKR